jgi:hypothetical protein
MNYVNYEQQIAEKYGVKLTGWPIHSPICNPGQLSSDDTAILKDALDHGMCKWRQLTPEEVLAWKDSNKQWAANGEPVYGPPRKPRSQKAHVIDSEMQVDDHVINENTA